VLKKQLVIKTAKGAWRHRANNGAGTAMIHNGRNLGQMDRRCTG
jgi:hypothetical protein